LEASWIGEWEQSLNLSHLSENTLLTFPISEFGLYSCGFLVHPL
jgi:hypothetical protein